MTDTFSIFLGPSSPSNVAVELAGFPIETSSIQTSSIGFSVTDVSQPMPVSQPTPVLISPVPIVSLSETTSAIRIAANLDNHGLESDLVDLSNPETVSATSNGIAFQSADSEPVQDLVQPTVQQTVADYNVQIAVVPDSNRIRIRQPGQILGFEIVPPVDESGQMVFIQTFLKHLLSLV